MVHTLRPGMLGSRQRASGTYFQRTIVALDIATPDGRLVRVSTGVPPEKRIRGRVLRYVLICSDASGEPHTRATIRHVPSSTRSNTAPCDACGAAPRLEQCAAERREAAEEHMQRYGIRQALRRWATSGETPEQNAIVEAMRLWGRLLAAPPQSPDDERLRERIVALLVEAGFHDALDCAQDERFDA